MLRVKIPMSEGDEPPDHGKREPAEEETECEDEECPPPLNVHQRGENVRQITSSPLRNVRLM